MKVSAVLAVNLFFLTLIILGFSIPVQAQFATGHKVSTLEKEESLESQEAQESDEEILVAEKMPEYEGGWQAMNELIYRKLKYPSEAREHDIQGLVVVSFVVSKDGSLENYKIKRGIGGGCDEEALRVVKHLDGKWKPGSIDGVPVRVQFNVPVRFLIK